MAVLTNVTTGGIPESNMAMCFVFSSDSENRNTPRKTSQSKDENQQQTVQPTDDVESGNRTRATLVGGECSRHCELIRD